MSSGCLEEARWLLGLGGCGGSGPGAVHYPDIYVDLERAEPTETEAAVVAVVRAAMGEAAALLKDLADYGDGASAPIRAAIRAPSDEAVQRRAIDALKPRVLRQRNYYRFALHLEKLASTLLWELVSGPLPALEALEARQALAKELAALLHFALRFDAAKMACPALQNDFSFYRRSLARESMSLALEEEAGEPMDEAEAERRAPLLSDDEANLISFFYAQAAPMMEGLKSAVRGFVQEHPGLAVENTTELLGTLGNVCRVMAETPEVVERMADGAGTTELCLSALTAAALLYDDVSPHGLASRGSLLDPRLALAALRRHGRLDLVSTLRYQSRTLHPARIPQAYKGLFPD